MDEIERRMRAANPFPHTDFTADQKKRLVDIQQRPAPNIERTLRKLPTYFAAAAVLVIATLVAVATFVYLQPTHAYAATPPPLKTVPVEGTAAELLQEMSMELDRNRKPSFVIRFEAWSLAVTVDEPVPTVIVPQEHTLERLPDGSGSLLIRVGVPYTLDGAAAPGVEIGETVWEQTFGPNEFPGLYPQETVSEGNVEEYLRVFGGLGEAPTTANYLSSVRWLLSERYLGPDEQAAVLSFLATLPDLEALGRVTDRLGREGIAFAAGSSTAGGSALQEMLIVSTSGQGILAYEVTYLANDRSDIPAGAVIDYVAWK